MAFRQGGQQNTVMVGTCPDVLVLLRLLQLRFAEGLASHLTSGAELDTTSNQPFDDLLAMLPTDPAMASLLEPLVMPHDPMPSLHANTHVAATETLAAMPSGQLGALQCASTADDSMQRQGWCEADVQQQPPSSTNAQQYDIQPSSGADYDVPEDFDLLAEQTVSQLDDTEQLRIPSTILYQQPPLHPAVIGVDQGPGIINGMQELEVMMPAGTLQTTSCISSNTEVAPISAADQAVSQFTTRCHHEQLLSCDGRVVIKYASRILV